MAFDPCDPCTCIPANIDDRLFHQMALVALCSIASAVGPGDTWTEGASVLTRSAVTGAGSVAAGAYSVTIANVGSANGTVLGVAILPGQVLNFDTVADEANKVFELLPAIAYDGTGTTLHLTVQTT